MDFARFANPVRRLSEAQSKARVKKLRARGCTVKHVELPNGDVAVLKKCPRARNENPVSSIWGKYRRR